MLKTYSMKSELMLVTKQSGFGGTGSALCLLSKSVRNGTNITSLKMPEITKTMKNPEHNRQSWKTRKQHNNGKHYSTLEYKDMNNNITIM